MEYCRPNAGGGSRTGNCSERWDRIERAIRSRLRPSRTAAEELARFAFSLPEQARHPERALASPVSIVSAGAGQVLEDPLGVLGADSQRSVQKKQERLGTGRRRRDGPGLPQCCLQDLPGLIHPVPPGQGRDFPGPDGGPLVVVRTFDGSIGCEPGYASRITRRVHQDFRERLHTEPRIGNLPGQLERLPGIPLGETTGPVALVSRVHGWASLAECNKRRGGRMPRRLLQGEPRRSARSASFGASVIAPPAPSRPSAAPPA